MEQLITPTAYAASGKFNNQTAITATANALGSNVGSTLTATIASTGKVKATVVGRFIDGTEQVLLDTYI